MVGPDQSVRGTRPQPSRRRDVCAADADAATVGRAGNCSSEFEEPVGGVAFEAPLRGLPSLARRGWREKWELNGKLSGTGRERPSQAYKMRYHYTTLPEFPFPLWTQAICTSDPGHSTKFKAPWSRSIPLDSGLRTTSLIYLSLGTSSGCPPAPYYYLLSPSD